MDRSNRNLAITSAFAEELARSGVELAIVSPGSRSTPLAVAFEREPGIEVKVVVDERSAGFIGLGGALATGRPVALVCTSGTASANYLPAVVEADLSAVPLLALTADRPPELRGIGAGQTIDQVKLYGDAVRMFAEFGEHDADDAGLIHARSLACRAFAAANGDPRPGPVQINFGFREPLAPIEIEGSVTATEALALDGRGIGGGPLSSVSRGGSNPSVQEIETLQGFLDGVDRIMVIAGRGVPEDEIDAISRFCSEREAVLLAEPTSGMRSGRTGDQDVIWRYDAILSGAAGGETPDLVPRLIIRIGETPTSKRLRGWLSELEDVDQVIIDPLHGWHDPTSRVRTFFRSEPGSLLGGLGQGPDSDRSLLDSWMAAQDALPRLETEGPALTRPALHRSVIETSDPGTIIYTASSLAIRDQEAYAPPTGTAARYLANRGANGIDGLVASGIGAALATGERTVVLTGDVGLRHDVGSLESLSALAPDLRLVVINDGGGRIFERLPQQEAMGEEAFRRLMLTPFDLDLERLAEAYGLPYRQPRDLEAFEKSLAEPGPLLIEVVPSD